MSSTAWLSLPARPSAHSRRSASTIRLGSSVSGSCIARWSSWCCSASCAVAASDSCRLARSILWNALFRSVVITASNSPVSAADPLNACRVIILTSRSWPANGPDPTVAARIISPDAIRTQSVAPPIWKRSAAQIKTGNIRNSRDTGARVTATVTIAALASTATASTHHRTGRLRGHRAVRRKSSNGAITRTPIASPVHHTDHTVQKLRAGIASAARSATLPMVALTSIPAMAPSNTSKSPSRSRFTSVRNASLRSSQYAHSGASVLPVAIAITAGTDGPIGALTSNAPREIPGQIRPPSKSRQTRATPVGGHNGVTCPRTSCSRRPVRAAR